MKHLDHQSQPAKRKILNSWKEISKYLGLEVRTAQRWEKELGLPIFRIKKFSKTYVYAYSDELDKWMAKSLKRKTNPNRKKLKKHKLLMAAFLPTLATLTIIFFLLFLPGLKNPRLSSFKIDGSRLLIFNNHGKKLWSYDFNLPLNPKEYKNLPQKQVFHSNEKVNILFADIDKDKQPDVIFAAQTKDNSREAVFCFNSQGKLQWSYPAGKELKRGPYKYSADYDLGFLRLVDLNNDGYLETVITANHKIFFPGWMAVLDHHGILQGEYWNTGHLLCLEFKDFDNDGLKEIMIGGLNNNYNKACFLILDPRKINGSSPHIKNSLYDCDEFLPANEKYYVLIPQDQVGKKLNNMYEVIYSIDLLESGKFLIRTTFSQVLYEFDYKLRPTYLHLSDDFISRFNKLKKEGKINIPLTSFPKNKLLSEILYWDGTEWTKTPTMTKFWKDYKAMSSGQANLFICNK